MVKLCRKTKLAKEIAKVVREKAYKNTESMNMVSLAARNPMDQHIRRNQQYRRF